MNAKNRLIIHVQSCEACNTVIVLVFCYKRYTIGISVVSFKQTLKISIYDRQGF